MLSASDLLRRLDAFPRQPLATYPTPLEPLPRLSQMLGRDVFIKRDDVLGPGLGGKKTRKLEYLLADALAQGHDRVVTFGGLQSNHARITAAAARRLGLEPHLFFFERPPATLPGNLLIDHLLGAHIHVVPLGGGGGGMTLEMTNRLVHLLARLRVGRHYFIPVGGHAWVGALGYVRAAVELDAQAKSLGLENAWVIMAAGTGGTLTGLLTGLTLIGSSLRPLGIDVGKLWKGFPASLARLATELSDRLGEPRHFDASDIPLIEATYVGERYGKPSPAGDEAIHLLARTEGVLIDPIYTGKAFAGLLDLVKRGRLGQDTPIIFLHTGGLPGLFAF
jgi:D-cysteine desulfhydrase family pyridoxal phosphate-dependent enzyme